MIEYPTTIASEREEIKELVVARRFSQSKSGLLLAGGSRIFKAYSREATRLLIASDIMVLYERTQHLRTFPFEGRRHY